MKFKILYYIIYREKAVEKILLTLAFSTGIAVFLIVFFVMKEGIPAFYENDPVDFLTGTEWKQFYSRPSTDDATAERRIDPIKTFFAQLIGCTAYNNGHEIVYITSRVPREIQEELTFYNYDPKTFNIIAEKSCKKNSSNKLEKHANY